MIRQAFFPRPFAACAAIVMLFSSVHLAVAQADEPEIVTVRKGELLLDFVRTGRIDSATKHKLRVDPEAYRGELEVIEVIHASGSVKKGDVLLRFDPTALEEELEKARQNVYEAEKRLDLARQDQTMSLEANAIKLERAERANLLAQHELEIWEKFNRDRMLTAARLSVEGRENALVDQKEELGQLEKMYEGTRLDSETKEIVLDRARRSVRMSEEWLGITRNDFDITRNFRHGDEDQQVRAEAQHKTIELGHTRLRNRMDEIRKEMELIQLERALDESRKRVGDLENDLDRLVVRAPANGVMTTISLDPGDTVGGRAVITEVIDPDDLIVRFQAEPNDLRVVAQGESVTLSLAEFPEVTVEGDIERIDLIGTASGESTKFDGVIRMRKTDPMMRLGLRCEANAQKAMKDVLILPKKAVTTKNGKSTCIVVEASGEQIEREIRVGSTGENEGEMVQIVSGLSEGDQVIIKAANGKSKSGADDE